MSTTEIEAGTCSCCKQPLNAAGRCLNVDCTKAAEQATRAAARETRKATAGDSSPRAFTSSGRVD